MKNQIKLTLWALLTLMSVQTMAQNIQNDAVEAIVTRYPSEPLGEACAGYDMTVKTSYPQNTNNIVAEAKQRHEEAEANFPNVIEEAKRKHEDDLASYEERVEDRRENYKLEMEEWNKLSKIEKMAMQDHIPKLSLPRKPVYREPYPPQYREPNLSNVITYDPKVLADAYLAVSGYSQAEGTENVLIGSVEVGEFESMSPERKSRVESYYDKASGTTKKKTVYYYITKYKRPVYLNLAYNGETLHSGLFGESGEYVSQESSGSPSMKNLERETVTNALEAVSEYINEKYGYSPMQEKTTIFHVKNKKGAYDDLESAKDFALAGIAALENNQVNEDLTEAINIWKSEYGEADLEDKKARVNAKVAKAILWNLVAVSRMTNNIEDAKTYLAAIEEMKLNYNDKTWVKDYTAKIEESEKRLSANGLL
ncbi:MAG: hypothetical protein HKP14_04895 [Bacteroidia bacterium]|nr:hypothetical protein [Bacteroidia bacterium]